MLLFIPWFSSPHPCVSLSLYALVFPKVWLTDNVYAIREAAANIIRELVKV